MVAARMADLKRGGDSGVHKTNAPIGALPSEGKTRDDHRQLVDLGLVDLVLVLEAGPRGRDQVGHWPRD
jgi:hypothetical protein